MSNNQGSQQADGPPLNPWGPVPYSSGFAIFLVSMIAAANFFWGVKTKCSLYKAYMFFIIFTLIIALHLLAMDATLFLVKKVKIREFLVTLKNYTMWLALLFGWIGFTLFSFYKAREYRFGRDVTITTTVMLGLGHVLLFYLVLVDMGWVRGILCIGEERPPVVQPAVIQQEQVENLA
ncbi:hypothetical protein Lser_V15G17200 [Lactuca serriola]